METNNSSIYGKKVERQKPNYFKLGIKSFFSSNTWKRICKYKSLYLILLPSLLFLAIFYYAPYFGLAIAFQDFRLTEGITGSEWIGFKAFENIFANVNTSAYRFIRNTIYISLIRLAINFPIILIYSVLLREIGRKRFKSTVQTISYIPFFLSWVAVSGIAYNLFKYDGGLFNKMIIAFGGDPVSWYNTPGPWWIILAFSSLWKGLGWATLIYISGMGTINEELYDAVKMDGGGRFKQAITVNLPSLSCVICLKLLLDVASILGDDVDQIMAMVNGSSALGNTDVISSSMIMSITSGSGFAESTALNIFRGLVGFVLVLIVNRVVKKTGNNGIL